MPAHPQSLFDHLETSFQLLTTGPEPLAADGAVIGHGLPARQIPLDELRELLLAPATSFVARDAAVRVLVWRARAERDAAMVGLVGVLLPGLRAAARPVVRAAQRHGYAQDLEAEIVAGLVAAIGSVDLARGKLAARLIGEAAGAGRVALERLLAHTQDEVSVPVVVAPARPVNHPDLLLDQAVTAGVISPREAELIGAHRVEGVSLEELAARHNVGYDTLRKRRRRAERAVVAWLAARRLRHDPDA